MARSAHPVLLALICLTLSTLAGCFANDPGDSDAADDDDETGALADLPAGCDVARAAVAHGVPKGDAPASFVRRPDVVPCLARTGFASNEPTLGITSDGALFFHPAYTGSAVAPLRTSDRGVTWTLVPPKLAGNEVRPITLDPYIHVDITTDRVFVDDLLTVNCSILSWTDDAALTWDHSAAGCFETDHQTVFTGPPVVDLTLGYPNIVYRCAINAVALADGSVMTSCQSSLDGGRTWLLPGEPAFGPDPEGEGASHVPAYCDGGSGHGIVDLEGTVYLPKGWCGQPWLAISHDQGTTWTQVQIADNGMARDERGAVAHETAVGADPSGNLYYAWVANDRLPYLATSRDHGKTWSAPLMIGPPDLKESSLPALAVGTEGSVAVAYMGSSNAPGAPYPDEDCFQDPPGGCPQVSFSSPVDYSNVTWDGHLTITTDALEETPTFLSVTVNDPEAPLVIGRCGLLRCQEVGDFIDVQIGPEGTAFASFVDGCSSAMTTCAPDDDDVTGEGLLGWMWGVDLRR